MASLVDIYNIALGACGQTPIDDAEDTHSRAQKVRARFADVRDRVIAAHPWPEAKVRAKLATTTTAPVWEFTNAFALPNDPWCLRPLEIQNTTAASWRWEGRTIVTDLSAPLLLLYIGRIEDPQLMTPGLVTAIGYALGAAAAYSLTNSRVLGQEIMDEYRRLVGEGRSVAAQSSGQDAEDLNADSSFLAARD